MTYYKYYLLYMDNLDKAKEWSGSKKMIERDRPYEIVFRNGLVSVHFWFYRRI
jgi:uncharacterized membrane protein